MKFCFDDQLALAAAAEDVAALGGKTLAIRCATVPHWNMRRLPWPEPHTDGGFIMR